MRSFSKQSRVLEQKLEIFMLVVYLLWLFLLQILVNDLWIGWEDAHIPIGLVGSWIWALLKFAYWCLPILVYMFCVRKEQAAYFVQRYTLRIKRPLLLLVIPAWGILILLQNGLKLSTPNYDYLVNAIVATPLIEEFVFRGFVLEEISRRLPFWAANVVQSVLFALNHLPWFYTLGLFRSPILLGERLCFLIVLGMVSGYLVRNTKSMLLSVLLHAINNLLYG